MDNKIEEIIKILKENGHLVVDEKNVVDTVKHIAQVYHMSQEVERTKSYIDEQVEDYNERIRQELLHRRT